MPNKPSKKISRRFVLLGATALSFGARPALARAPEIFLDEGGIFRKPWTYALDGYDAVSYRSIPETGTPVIGIDDYVTEYKGALWRFSSQENLDLFQADPTSYVPAYGGYCAWALARDKLAKGDPTVWFIYENILYLNVSPRFQREWIENIDRDIAQGDANWPEILDRN